jgi:hypothetical protein
MKEYTKESLIEELKKIRAQSWIESKRTTSNYGSIGNTLEDLLGIEENNLPLANASEWELKTQRAKSKALVTLFHMEPSPTALKFVPQILIPNYGWPHKEAGLKYSTSEKSFRQTICAQRYSDRGFSVIVDHTEKKVIVTFDESKIAVKHTHWKQNIGLSKLNPQPYWGFNDLFYKLASKLHNCFFVKAQTQKINGKEYFHYKDIYMLKDINQDHFINLIESGNIYIDFDARTGHNHGTKFRISENLIEKLYSTCTSI